MAGRVRGSGTLGGLDGVGRLDCLRAGMDMGIDILRHVRLAVHSAETYCADTR